MESFSGKCVGGPYDGKAWVHFKKTMVVEMLVGNPLKEEIPRIRTGFYEFKGGQWIWSGPNVRPEAHRL